MKNYIGIDVAKATLAVAFPATKGGWSITTFSNTPDGVRSLMKQLPPQAPCILEATGSYSVLVTYMLCQAIIDVSFINPKQNGPPQRSFWDDQLYLCPNPVKKASNQMYQVQFANPLETPK